MLRKKTAIFCLPIFCASTLNPSATIAFVKVATTQSSDTPPAFSENGKFVTAGNFNGPTETRGTNVFQGDTLNNSNSPATWSSGGLSVTIAASSNGLLSSATLPTPTDDLYLTEIFAPNQLTMSLTISGLNPALIYLMQFPHGEDRTISYSGTQTFLDSSNNSATTLLNFGNSTTTPNGQKFSLTNVIVSDSTSLTYDMPPGGRGPSFDGFSVRVVPEPATSLSILGITFLGRRRRNCSVPTSSDA